MSSQHSFPIEVITRILSFALASPLDDPQKLPSPRPHPVSVLLVCKEITRALLPEFYKSINVFEPRDWYTLFNPDFGVLAVDESDKVAGERRFPPLSIRKGWVAELFLGITQECEPVGLPYDIAKVLNSNDAEIEPVYDLVEFMEHSIPIWLGRTRLLEPRPLDLPRLATLVTLPVSLSGLSPDLGCILDKYADALRERLSFKLISSEEDAMHGILTSAQGDDFDQLKLPASVTSLHLPFEAIFSGTTYFTVTDSVYECANEAELFAYLTPDKVESTSDDAWTALDHLVHRFFGTPPSFFGPPVGGDKPVPVNKNVVLVGSREVVEALFERDMSHEVDLTKIRTWDRLAPDGKRRSPLAALEMN